MKKLSRVLVLVLYAVMVLAMSASVFAGVNDYTGTKNTGNTIKLTKEFQVPEGVDVPTDAFAFTATPVTTGDEVDLVTTASDYPTLTFTDITFGNGDRAKASDETLVKQSNVDLSTLSFPRAGLYEWTITESTEDSTKIDANANSDTYKLRVYVKNGTSGREISTITIEDKAGNKIDGGLTDKDETVDTDQDGDKTNDGNDFRFVNKYIPQDVTTNPTDPDTPNDPSDDTGAFKLTKTTSGEFADKTHEFEFTVTVTFPAGVDASKYPITGLTDGKVKLADGGTWTIAKLPEGTKITVSEEATAHYTPSYTGKHTQAGQAVDLTVAQAQEGEALAVPGNIIVGAKGANVAYTNTFDDTDVTPTGIIINNLPYVLLIGIALGGIVLFSRKRRYE